MHIPLFPHPPMHNFPFVFGHDLSRPVMTNDLHDLFDLALRSDLTFGYRIRPYSSISASILIWSLI